MFKKMQAAAQSDRPAMHFVFLVFPLLFGVFACINFYHIVNAWIGGEEPLKINSTTLSLMIGTTVSAIAFIVLRRLYKKTYFASRTYTRFIGNGFFVILLCLLMAMTDVVSPFLYRPFLQDHGWERCTAEENPNHNPSDNWEIWRAAGKCAGNTLQ